MACLTAIRAERSTDRALAEEALHVLEGLTTEATGGGASESAAERFEQSAAERLEQLDRILASLPRDRARGLLRQSRDAFRDGLYWQLKSAPARSLVVDANSFYAPGALPRLGLRADDADRAALGNLRAALKFIIKAKEEIGTMN